MDEPSATLTHRELENLFRMIRGLSESGVAVIYISHRLEEIFALATRVSVLRDGRLVSTRPVGELDRPSVIRMMVGRELSDEFPSRSVAAGAEILRVEDLSRRSVLHGVSFSLRAGEVVGVAGLVGSGRTELALTLYGAGPHDGGRVLLAGRPVHFRHPRQAIAAGVGLVTEDRSTWGCSSSDRSARTCRSRRSIC
jgi:ribose transport system ATP-binding protein